MVFNATFNNIFNISFKLKVKSNKINILLDGKLVSNETMKNVPVTL